MSNTTDNSYSKDESPEGGFNPAPREEWSLLFQGAEARVWKLPMQRQQQQSTSPEYLICKERFAKAYRHPVLDERLTKSRCRSEARMLEKCGKSDKIRVPNVVRVEAPILYMEYIEAPSLKEYLLRNQDKEITDEFVSKLAKEMGILVGTIHTLGVIHGDLTSSNMLIVFDEKKGGSFELVVIDFGLAKSSSSVEEQAVDLYVLERAIQSTHPELPETFFDEMLKNYSDHTAKNSPTTAPKKSQQSTLSRLEQVRLRGRKRECFG
jgi:TP53 regulating kinase and related kinases